MSEKSRLKIGLLTHHWPPNFGANLQTLSTYQLLTNYGHDVWVLNYRSAFLENRYRQKVCREQIAVHDDFCNKYLRLSPVIRSQDELIDYSNELEFDKIIVGSDAVFRLSKEMKSDEGAFPNPFWLTWASKLRNKPKLCSLAASCTGSMYLTFPKAVKKDIAKALDNFNYISVRDRWTRLMFYLISGGKCLPNICPDPVSVFNHVFELPEEYEREPKKKQKKYILLSLGNNMLPHEWIREFVDIAHEHDHEVYSLPLPEGEIELPVDAVIRLPLSPVEWYAWIRHAAGFLGIRFHTIMCSIFNNVPFVSIDNNVKKCLRFIPVRLRSKQYDLCRNIRSCSRCFVLDKLRETTPKKVWYMLKNWDSNRINKYILNAGKNFTTNIEMILNS
jgi:hypothetical protein